MPEVLIEQIKNIDTVQFLVLIFGVTEVLLARANKILLYPAGIIATTLSVYSLFHAELYAECMLNLYYIIMSVYGWWYWIKKKHEPPVKITYATKNDWLVTIVISLGGWIVLYYVLTTFTPSNVPLWDAGVSSTAWAGMWLLARRKIENWILLNISNAAAIPLLFQKELPLFALLTIFLFIVACVGFLDWIKIYRRENMPIETGETCQ
jgi:nicotinamide mononucleotide transporter